MSRRGDPELRASVRMLRWRARQTLGLLGCVLSIAGCNGEQGAPSRADRSPEPGDLRTVAWSTYLGGATPAAQRPARPTRRNLPPVEQARDVAADSRGNVYIAGGTYSTDFPRTIGPSHAGDMDAFLVKLAPDGTLLWSRLIGGPNYERAYGVEVRPGNDNEIVICGRGGPDLPTQACAGCNGQVISARFNGDIYAGPLYGPQDGWVGKVDGDGQILWLSYFADDSGDMVRDCDIDRDGFVYAGHGGRAGATPNLGTYGAFRSTSYQGRGGDALIAKLDPEGRSVVWATYLGGTGGEDPPAVRVHSDGTVYVATDTTSADFPLVNPVDRARGGARDFALARLSADGRTLLFSTLLGGNGSTEFVGTHNLGVDASGNAYLCAETDSTDFPGTSGFFQPANAGGVDHIFAKVRVEAPTTILAATYVGGPGRDGELAGCAVDAEGNVLAAAASQGSGRQFPTTPGAVQRDNRGGEDVTVMYLAADFRSLRYATYLGGSGDDGGRAAALAPDGLLVVGTTLSPDFPVLRALQPRHAEAPITASDAFVTKLWLPAAAGVTPSASSAESRDAR